MFARFANSRNRSKSNISRITNGRSKNVRDRDGRQEQEWY
jgi:hypothetical protein